MNTVATSFEAARIMDADGVVLTQASAIKVILVAWLWPDWLAESEVHLASDNNLERALTRRICYPS